MTPLTTKAAEIRAGLVAELRRAVTTGEDGCGTLPAKEAVKVCPVDWHRITRLAREAAGLIEQQAAELAEARADLVTFVAAHALANKRATTAESERDELLREKERLGAALQKLHDAASVFHNAALVHLSDTTFDSDGGLSEADAELSVNALPGARSALENGPAGLADAHSKSPDPSSQSERIAVLEAALREKDRVVQLYGKHDKMTDREKIGAIINHPCFDAALSPLGEE